MSKGHSQKAKGAERGARSAPFAKLFGLTDTPLQRKVWLSMKKVGVMHIALIS